MQALAENFINQNEENKILYKKALNYDENACNALTERFKSYLYKIHATSYLHKSIILNSRELKSKYSKLYRREELSLNSIDLGFKEEKINSIPDNSIDWIEEITIPTKIDFTEIFTDVILVSAIKKLTDKQKKIVFLVFVLELDEKEIAKELKISIQAVYKTKKVAINKIRKELGGGGNNNGFF